MAVATIKDVAYLLARILLVHDLFDLDSSQLSAEVQLEYLHCAIDSARNYGATLIGHSLYFETDWTIGQVECADPVIVTPNIVVVTNFEEKEILKQGELIHHGTWDGLRIGPILPVFGVNYWRGADTYPEKKKPVATRPG